MPTKERSSKKNSESELSKINTQNKTATKTRNKKTSKTKNNKTTLIIQFDAGYKNTLFIRGQGISDLSWDKGVALKNIKNDEWVWESEHPFTEGEFKILINDNIYELGENHRLSSGMAMRVKPHFPS